MKRSSDAFVFTPELGARLRTLRERARRLAEAEEEFLRQGVVGPEVVRGVEAELKALSTEVTADEH